MRSWTLVSKFFMSLLTFLSVFLTIWIGASSASSPVKVDRAKELEAGKALLSSRIQRSSNLPLPLRLRLGFDRIYDYRVKFSYPILDACLSYLETPGHLHTIENKSATIKRILRFADEAAENETNEANRKNILTFTLTHPICHDAFKSLGEAMTASQCRKFESYLKSIFVLNPSLFFSLKDFSWMTEASILSFKAAGLLQRINFFSSELSAFAKTAPFEVLAVAIAYDFEGSCVDQLQERFFQLPETASILALYPVLSALPNEKRNVPVDYDYNSTLLIQDLRSHGITIANMQVLLTYVQVTDALISRNLNMLADDWVESTLNWQFEDVTEKIKQFQERASWTVDLILNIRDARAALLSTFEEVSACEEPIAERFPNWKELFRNVLRNPVNPFLRFILHTLSDVNFHAVIHADDAASILPLPRANQTEPLKESFPLNKRHPMLWNALIRNVFFVNGEDWRRQVPSDFNWSDAGAIKAHLRQEWQFIYEHSQDKPVNPVQTIADRYSLFKAFTKFNVPEKNFLLETAEMLPPSPFEVADLESVYFKLLSSIPCRRFALHELDYLRLLFSSSKLLSEIVDIYKENCAAGQDDLFKPGFGLDASIFRDSLNGLIEVDNLFSEGKSVEAQKKAFFVLRTIARAEAMVYTCGTDMTSENFQAILNNPDFISLFNRHGRLFSSAQVKALLECEQGIEFLKQNLSGAQSLIDYSSFTEDLMKRIGLNADGIRINFATLPKVVKLLTLTRASFVHFADVIKVNATLGTDFLIDPMVIANPRVWEAINPLLCFALDPNWTKAVQLGLLTNTVVTKLKTFQHVRLEACISTLVKWLIQQECIFFMYHVLVQTFENDSSFLKRLHVGYRELLLAEVVSRREIAAWIDEVLPVISRPEIIEPLQLIKSALDHPLTKLRRDHLLSVAQELQCGEEFVVISGKLYRSSNPYGTCVELRHLFKSTSHVTLEHLSALKQLIKDESVWVAKLEAVSQFERSGVCGSLMDAFKLLNRLPVLDAVIYKLGLEMMGIDANAILNKSVSFFDAERREVLLQGSEKLVYKVAFGFERNFTLATDAEKAAYQEFLAKQQTENKKSNKSKNKKK